MTSTRLNWNENSAGYQFAYQVVQKLQERGFTAYFAGGCVRDALMGNPAHDFDVATDARVEQIAELFGPKNTLAIGAAFGVACVHGKRDGQRLSVEVATFRADGNYSDGRRPDWVHYSSPEEDAQRRDFTINGMFYDPVAGEVKDFVGGRNDLKSRQITAIGNPDDRIREDKLRMLRAVRFGARFGFSIANRTMQAITTHAHEIHVVSGERISAEMSKLFETDNRVLGMELLYESGLLQHIWPKLAQDWERIPSHKVQAIALIKHLPATSSFAACLAASSLPTLLHQRGAAIASKTYCIPKQLSKSWTLSLQDHWKFSNLEAQHLEFALMNAGLLVQSHSAPWSSIQPILIGTGIQTGIQLAESIPKAYEQPTDGVTFARSQLLLPTDQLNPSPWITGDDLKKLGKRPGPAFAQILAEARRRQLDGIDPDRDAQMAWAATCDN